MASNKSDILGCLQCHIAGCNDAKLKESAKTYISAFAEGLRGCNTKPASCTFRRHQTTEGMVQMPLLENQCPWTPLDPVHRLYVGVAVIILGTLGVAANGWLVSGFLLSPLRNVKTHLLMLNLAIACLGRGMLAGFPFIAASTLAGRWLFGDGCCQFFAFLQQVFGVSQVVTVAMLAAERILVVTRLCCGASPSLQHYAMGILSCWTVAIMLAVGPLLGWGRYGCDPTAVSCSLQWSLNTDEASFVYNICLLILGAILPAALMSVCVWWAVMSNGQSAGTHADHPTQRALTKTAEVLVTGLCITWLPQSLLVLWTLTGMPLPLVLVVLAAISSEASAIIPILAYTACDRNMCRAVLGILGTSTSSAGKEGEKYVQLTDLK